MENKENQNKINHSEKIKKDLLKGMTLSELKEYFTAKGEAAFRGEQLFNWMYNHLSTDFNEMKNISKSLREKLNTSAELLTLDYVDSDISPKTGTKKFILSTRQNHKIETVIIPEKTRNTLCISTQVGCPLDCQFCATALMGYKKNLTAGEIFDQYLLAAKDFGKENLTNIVYMGMGEPLLNFNSTVKSLEIFSSELLTGITPNKITVSTAGIAPRIYDLAKAGVKVKLALSLHSCFEEIRSRIMPINNKYSLKENIDAVKFYYSETGKKITFEYILFNELNDREEDIKAIIKLCKQVPSKINIIPFNSLKHMNPVGFAAELQPSTQSRFDNFIKRLKGSNITVMVRYSQGDDIAAACGQLAIKY
jgi:23S rRNA (adenine2503-C2)-methyltransferase